MTESLLKLQPQVVVGTASGDGVELPRRAVSIPVSRLADARKHAASNTLRAGGTNGALTTNTALSASVGREYTATKTSYHSVQPFAAAAPFLNETKSKWPMLTVPSGGISPAAEKAVLVEEFNKKGTVAYPGGAVLPALMRNLSDVERILYTLLPPKRTVCKETGNTILQCVSTEPSSRLEVADLHERLTERLRQRRARDSGICPIRREVYAEVFDELIRQVTLEEPTRGILLLRIRDELYQTLAAHSSLAERAMYFASKQREEAGEGMDELKRRIRELEEMRLELIARKKAVQVREEQILRAIEQENNARSKLRQDEVGYYRRANRQLTQRIKSETERTNAQGVVIPTIVTETENNENGDPQAAT
ncbi:33 kDa inner dynein arm light chain, axonemal, putative [Trypanosoma cruzi marinkellei]|uniref:33 kDa inner dynein arm light chain, axonemal, putative n=1 Tax=Trypanosoma cruzi marinkellei TaxID=85056 RepID=K2LYG6_TRYCR|nr:33 kDa inner dynein arm light chain, axonemal, putative [Trypanosoma cruzi marinkellei]